MSATRRYSIEDVVEMYTIERLLFDYAVALNTRDWEAYRKVFTDDATIDYTDAGGIRGSVSEVTAWVAQAFTAYPESDLYITNPRVELVGDRATSVCSFFETARRPLETGGKETLFLGGEYHDEMVKVDEAWLVSKRTEHLRWVHGPFPAADD